MEFTSKQKLFHRYDQPVNRFDRPAIWTASKRDLEILTEKSEQTLVRRSKASLTIGIAFNAA